MAKKSDIVDVRTCSMCIHSTDYHERNNLGEPFLCKCQFFKWDRFLYKTTDVCFRFESRPEYVRMLTEKKLINNNPWQRKRPR